MKTRIQLIEKGEKWRRNQATCTLRAKLQNFKRDFWSRLHLSNASKQGRRLMARIRQLTLPEISGRGMQPIETRFVKIKLSKENLDIVNFKVHVCKTNFEKRCPRKFRTFLRGHFHRFSEVIQFD